MALHQDLHVETTRLCKRSTSPSQSASQKNNDASDDDREPIKSANITFVSITANGLIINFHY
jgi:hypothetical protein